MSQRYGVWSEADGGYIAIEDDRHSALNERSRLIHECGEYTDGLTVMAECPEHEEQPKDGCEDCNAEEEL